MEAPALRPTPPLIVWMSSSWLFLGRLVSTRARLRFTSRVRVCCNTILPVEDFSSNGQLCLNCCVSRGGKRTQRLVGKDGRYEITEPRILNGAQTVATVAQFAERFTEHPKFKANLRVLRDVKVLCKIVAKAEDDFIRAVTVSTNRQNPVHPANLRANDPVQLQIADWLRESSLLYERQENSAAWQDPGSSSPSKASLLIE